jgi:multidrug efflux pump subunit AcrB
VTLTGVIVGVGMLLDDAIVVLENIERHYHGLGEDLAEAVVGGTQEVMLAILSGTYATVAVLVPIVWIGGYVQAVLRPLSLTLSIALLASYLVSVTIIPILAPVILRLGGGTGRWGWEKALDRRLTGRVVHAVQELFVRAVRHALRRRALFVAAGVVRMSVWPAGGRQAKPRSPR